MSEFSGLLDARGRPFEVAASMGATDTAYQGASRVSRETAGWDPRAGDADSDANPELETLTSRARDLDRNSGFAQNLRATKNDSVIGTGLQWQPLINWSVLGRDKDWANELGMRARAIWNDFSNSRHFDADGRNNFHLHSKLIYNGRFMNGSAIAIPMWRERPGTPYRTCIKVIEADRLSNPDGNPDTDRISGGVEVNARGEVVAYHIRNRHPGSDASLESPFADTWERIEAYWPNGRARFLHIYSQSRANQSRGVSAISAVMAAFGIRGKYQLTELQAAEAGSRVSGILETPLSDEAAQALFGGEKEDYKALRRQWSGRLTAGGILKLPPGTEYKTHIPNRPATAYVGFMDHVSREIGLAVGLPDQLSQRDFTKVNYSSARAALLEAWRGFYVERAEISFQWATPCLDLLLEDAVDLGLLDMPDYDKFRSAYTAGKWLAKGHQPIDRLKHETANKTALEIGTTTLRDIYAEDGEDWAEQMEQQFREAELAAQNEFRLKALRAELAKEYNIEDVPSEEPDSDDGEAPSDEPESDEEIDRRDDADEDADEPAGSDDE